MLRAWARASGMHWRGGWSRGMGPEHGREKVRLAVSQLRSVPRRLADRLIMQPQVQQCLLPFGRELRPQRWIFVLGCYNSGTTLLATMLRQHPDIAGLPTEGASLSDALPYPERFGWPRMWHQCPEQVRADPEDGEARASRIRLQWSLW